MATGIKLKMKSFVSRSELGKPHRNASYRELVGSDYDKNVRARSKEIWTSDGYIRIRK